MKHRRLQRTLGRAPAHRASLLKNLTSSLLEHGSVTTTEAKAKELKRWFEPLVTEARGDLTLATRRQLLSRLGSARDLERLVRVAQSNESRPGGYMRLTRLPGTRHDGAPITRIEIEQTPETA